MRRHPQCLFAIALLVLLLLDMYHVGFLMPHITYHHYRRRWVRQYSAWDWKHVAAARTNLPRYQVPGNLTFPIWVLSLARSTERRDHVRAELAAAGVHDFEFVDALDGDGDLPEAEVQTYFTGERLAKFRARTPNARYKVACDLSHFRLMHRLLGTGLPMALVLEDDFAVPPASRPLLPALRARLGALPAGWDVLHLSLCDATPQAWAGPGVRLFSRGFCTLGTLYTRRAALRALRAAEVGLRNVDNLLLDLALTGALASYLADPPLVQPLPAARWPSEIDREPGAKDPF